MDPEEVCRQYWPETAFAKKVFLHSIVEAGRREEELEQYYHVCESKDILHSCDQHGHAKVYNFNILPAFPSYSFRSFANQSSNRKTPVQEKGLKESERIQRISRMEIRGVPFLQA